VAGPLALNRWDHTLALDQDLSTSKLPGPRVLLAAEPTGRPLFRRRGESFRDLDDRKGCTPCAKTSVWNAAKASGDTGTCHLGTNMATVRRPTSCSSVAGNRLSITKQRMAPDATSPFGN
jgi:hypothetical protein